MDLFHDSLVRRCSCWPLLSPRNFFSCLENPVSQHFPPIRKENNGPKVLAWSLTSHTFPGKLSGSRQSSRKYLLIRTIFCRIVSSELVTRLPRSERQPLSDARRRPRGWRLRLQPCGCWLAWRTSVPGQDGWLGRFRRLTSNSVCF